MVSIYKTPAKDVYHNFYNNILLLYIVIVIFGLTLIFVVFSTINNVLGENKTKYKLLKILGMRNYTLIFFKATKVLILVSISTLIGFILSYVTNTIITIYTKEILFDMIYLGISNPIFTPQDIRLFLF